MVQLLLTSLGERASAIAAPPDLIANLEQIEAEHRSLCPDGSAPAPLAVAIAPLVEGLRGELAASTGGENRVRALNALVFETLAIRPSSDLHDPCNLLPSVVLARQQGYCVGIAAVYLALADRLHLPIHAVATPSHLFLRYDDGITRINIETAALGTPVPDDRYAAEQKIEPASIRRGIFMGDLATDGFLAHLHNNLGVIYSERGNFARAAQEYNTALDLLPHFPAAFYNSGNDLLQSGDYSKATRVFTLGLRLYPNDLWALNNRGVAYMKAGKLEKARRDFEAALNLDPTFQQARRNLEGLQVAP